MRQFWQIAAVTVTLATGVPGMVWAQVPQDTVATPTLATPTQDDINLLKKAMDAVQKNPVTVTSDLKVKASGNGVQMSINETIKVTGRFPGRFRSDVTLLDEDGKTPAVKFQVIGDGKTVTTYRPGLKQYGMQSIEAFQKDFAMPSIGVLCALIASGDQWLGDDVPVTAFLEALKTNGMSFESGPSENGRRIFVIHPVNPDAGGYRIQAVADPLTGSFVVMEMSGKTSDWKFTITETIRSMAKLPAYEVAPFVPPADATKVAKLAVWPF